MAITYVGSALTDSEQWGVESDETGINIESFEPTHRPERKEFLLNKTGEKKGFAVAPVESEYSVTGEVNGATGLMAATFVAAVTLANDDDTFGASGAVFMDEVSLPQGREAWKKFSARYSQNAGITAA